MTLRIDHLIVAVIFSTHIFLAWGQGNNTYDCRRLDDCQRGGACSIDDGSCFCQTKFSGYNCQIIDGTTCNSSHCINGTCYVEDSVEKCGCIFGFYGEACDRETVDITCEGTRAQYNLTFPESFSGTVKLSGSDIPEICSFVSSTESGFTTYSLTVDMEQDGNDTFCGRNNIAITGDTTADANYTGKIEVRYYDLIISNTDQLFKLTCLHKGGDVEVSKEITNIGVDPEDDLTQVEVLEPYSPINFEVVDNEGGVLSETLYVGDSYKICFFLMDTSVYKSVYIKSCTTNNTLQSPNDKTYDIYNEGCPTKKSMRTTGIQQAANKTIDGVTYPSVCLPVTAFKFVDSDNLALACKVQLCKENDSSCDLPTVADCEEVIQNEGVTTTVAPDTNTTEAMNTNTTDSNSTTDAPNNNDNSTTDAPNNDDNSTTDAPNNNDNSTTDAPNNNDNSTTDAPNNNDNSTTDAPNNNDNSTTDAPNNNDNSTTDAPNNNDNSTTDAPNNNADNTTAAPNNTNGGNTTDATGGGNDETTDGNRRRRRAADDTDEKTVSTIIKVYGGQRVSTADQNQGQVEATVEECLSRTEIMAVVTVLGSAVLILFIACFILTCALIKRKSKMTLFEPHPYPKPDRFQIPRAHVNQAYREI